jgi:hypothetical protein
MFDFSYLNNYLEYVQNWKNRSFLLLNHSSMFDISIQLNSTVAPLNVITDYVIIHLNVICLSKLNIYVSILFVIIR